MILLHEKNENDYKTNGLGAIDPWVVSGEVFWRLNGEYTLTFRYPLHAFLGFEIKNGMQVEVLLDNFSDVFRIKKTKKSMGYLDVFCEHKSYDLIDNFIHDINIVEKTGQMAMTQIQNGMAYPHPFVLVSEIGDINSARMVRLGGMQAIADEQTPNSFVSRWGGEFERHYNTITNKRRIGTNRRLKIEYAKDLVGYEAEIDDTDVVTRIIPIGFNGLLLPEKYVDSPLMDAQAPKIRLMNYDSVKEAVGEYADDEDALPTDKALDELRRLAALEFSENNVDKPKTSYSVDFVLLANTQEYENVAVLQEVQGGDIVEVNHPKDQFTATARVIEYYLNPMDGRYTSMKLGDVEPSLVAQIVTQRDVRDVAQNIVKQEIAATNSFVDELKKDIEKSWRNEDGFNYELKAGNAYGLPAGYYSFDRAIDDNPTSVIGISAGRLVIANRKDDNGEFVFTTFGTGDGLAADMVGAKQLKADVFNANNFMIGSDTLPEVINRIENGVNDQAEAIERARTEAEQAAKDFAESQLQLEKERSDALLDDRLTQTEQARLEALSASLAEAMKYADDKEAEYLQKAKANLDEAMSEIRTYMRSDPDTGDILIGKAGNPMLMRLTNDRLSFESDGREVAYFSSGRLKIQDAEILGSLMMGGYIWRVEADSGLSLVWTI